MRTDPMIGVSTLIVLAFGLFSILYCEIETEKLTTIGGGEELAVANNNKEEKFVISSSKLRNKKEDADPPMTIEEVTEFLSRWVGKLDTMAITGGEENNLSAEEIWKIYHELTHGELVPWDKEYLRRLPIPRQDDSIFLSIATFRDENCINTLNWAYGNATYPHRLFVGLVQQNCYENCRSGVLEEGGTKAIPPDDDCHESFCQQNPEYCNQIRPLKFPERESLGPYGARFLASKLYGGEQWYMQMDAHMTFLKHWDDITVKSLHRAPSEKPVLSHYPPGHNMDLQNHWGVRPAGRLCGPMFSRPDRYMIRMEGLKKWDKLKIPIPRFGPFAAAGFLAGTALLLQEVPFDPYLPWIFMGEEIIMSTRFWTSGYDLFSPAQAVVGHIYVRSNKPKFWDSMHRVFHKDDLDEIPLLRIKHQLGYPEAARDLLSQSTVLDDLSRYGMGHARTLEDYMKYAGIDVMRKESFLTYYCEEHRMPPGKQHLAKLYEDAEIEARKNATLVEAGK